jgi:hypothetical protein
VSALRPIRGAKAAIKKYLGKGWEVDHATIERASVVELTALDRSPRREVHTITVQVSRPRRKNRNVTERAARGGRL